MELNYQYRAADMVGDAGGFWTVVTAAWVAALLPFALFLHSIELLSNGEAGKDHDHPSNPKPLQPGTVEWQARRAAWTATWAVHTRSAAAPARAHRGK